MPKNVLLNSELNEHREEENDSRTLRFEQTTANAQVSKLGTHGIRMPVSLPLSFNDVNGQILAYV